MITAAHTFYVALWEKMTMNISLVKHLIGIVLSALILLCINGCKATALINLQSGNSFAEHEWKGELNTFTVPFEWHDGHPIITVSINGTQDLRLALDSGAAATVVFETPRTQALDIEPEMQLDLQGTQVNLVNDAIIDIGEISLSKMTIIHVPIDQSPLFGSLHEAYFDGAIGFDLLSRYVTQFNYADQTITFYNQNTRVKNDTYWTKLPMDLIGRIPHISAKLYNQGTEQSDYIFTLDTGAPDYLYINSSLANNLTFPEASFKSLTKNFEGEFTLLTSRLDRFEIGGVVFKDIAAHDLPHFKDDNGIGLIGSGLLKNFDLIFDYEEGYVALKKNKHFSNSTAIDRSGLQLEPHKFGAIVKSVASDTHAATLGVAKGDVVISIDNEQITPANFDQLRDQLSSNNSKLNLCWQSKDNLECGVLRLSDRI